ncbi:PAS domain-containing protein [Serratia proteamaculans]
MLNNGKPITDNIKRIRKDGEAVWLQGTYTPVMNKQGGWWRSSRSPAL